MPETILETRTCVHCSSKFDITDIDADFLTRLVPTITWRKFSLPFPTHCPKCRKTRRYAWRNEKNIYKRKCDATGKEIISLFSPDAPCPVYESEYWYSDKWDAHKYGRDFDFSRSFFEQWGNLKKLVPMPGKSISRIMDNSDYSDNCSGLKNCYLCFNAGDAEDCSYTVDMWDSKDCIDCFGISDCENCYELLDARNCYSVHFSFDIRDCRDSLFLYDCEGCKNCYGCFGLRNQQYFIYNQSFTEIEYKKEIEKIYALSLSRQKMNYQTFLRENWYPWYISKNTGSENVSHASRVFDSRNVSHSTIINDSENIRYSWRLRDTRMALDCHNWWDRLDRAYESLVIGEATSDIYFSTSIWANTARIFYSVYCIGNVRDCFGCVGLRESEYCILNKQYTKEEYENLVPKIIAHMKQTNEWGEFTPPKYSHFGYNETMNMVKHPLSKEEALSEWFYWSDYEAPFPKVGKIIPASKLPDTIGWVPDDILNWAIECEVSGKPFRIIRQELEFYRRHNLPIPRKHPDERYRDRTKIYLNY